MTLQQRKDILEELYKKSRALFKQLPESRKEFDEVDREIIRIIVNKKRKQLEFKL